MPTIKLENVTVKYGKKSVVTAIDSLSTSFYDKKVNVIVGESGCGKTSLLRAIIGLEKFDGDIYFDQENSKYLSIKDRNVGYVSQKIALYPFNNLFKNIASPLVNTMATGEEIRNRVSEAAKLLNITECLYRKPKEISIGQAQRAAIARAMVKKPIFYAFDEAFSNLDEQTSAQLCYELAKLFKETQATVIFVTHDLKEALSLGDYIFVMKEGKIVEVSTPEEILSSTNKDTRELFKNYDGKLF